MRGRCQLAGFADAQHKRASFRIMTQPGDPPTSSGSGRSIYERLGLTPMLGHPPRRPPSPRPAPDGPRRGTLRYLIGVPLILGALALTWIYLPAEGGRGAPSFVAGGSSEDDRRLDEQDVRTRQLETRVEVLEIKMRALQKVDGYQAALQRPAPHAAKAPLAD